MKLVIAGEHLTVQDVDLQVADAETRYELAGLAKRAAYDGTRPCDEIVRDEGNADVVVSAPLERVERSP